MEKDILAKSPSVWKLYTRFSYFHLCKLDEDRGTNVITKGEEKWFHIILSIFSNLHRYLGENFYL